MPRRNSPRIIENLDDLSYLDTIVVDKRSGQRASAKKNRRNRHYEKQFIRNSLTQGLVVAGSSAAGDSRDIIGEARPATPADLA